MNRISRSALALFVMAGAAASALAGLPKVMDYVPGEAMVVIASSSLSKLDAETSQLLGAINMPQATTPLQMLATLNLREGLDVNGSAALALLPGDMEADVPPAVAILPTSDYAKLLANFGATASTDGGVDTFEFDGQPLFARRLEGGFTAIGPVRELVEGVSPKGGSGAAFTALAGKVGEQIADRSEVFVLGNVKQMGPILDQVTAGMKEQMEEAAAKGGPQAGQAQAALAMMDGLMERIKRDGRALAAGMDVGAVGVGAELGLMFNDGTETATMLQGSGRAASLLKRLPNKPFMLAGAFDLKHPAARALKDATAALQPAEAPMGILGGAKPKALLDLIHGQAVALYPNPAGIMAGLLANGVSFVETPNPKAYLEAMKQFFTSIGQGGEESPFTASFTPEETQVDGVTVDGWGMQFNATGPEAMQAMQAMTILFGPGGMGGYLAAVDGGVFQTMSKNSALLSELMKTGAGASLADDAAIKQIAARLPDNRIAEGYVGMRPILEQVLPFMQMFIPVQVQVPAELPPIGGGVSADGGAARAGAFVPAQVIKFGAEFAQQAQQMMAPQGGPAGGEEGGQPKF